MNGKFESRLFSEIDLNDSFFASLKNDYPEFETEWFPKCVREGRSALVFSDEDGLGAFVATKTENEPVVLTDKVLPSKTRLKISTLRLAERFRGQRLGEGAIGRVLWEWQSSPAEEIYVTTFPNHEDIITQFLRFGFVDIGQNNRGEHVYLRSRKEINFSDPYKAFPFISPDFRQGKYLIVNDEFHDTLFPYSELSHTYQEILDRDTANGVSKVYIGQLWQKVYNIGDPVFIYRRYTRGPGARFKSCLTSYGVVTDMIQIKAENRPLKNFSEFLSIVGNKSVYTQIQLQNKFKQDKNLMVIKLLYCGYFGGGNNINMNWLDQNGLWPKPESNVYPTAFRLSPRECIKIWQQANRNIPQIFG